MHLLNYMHEYQNTSTNNARTAIPEGLERELLKPREPKEHETKEHPESSPCHALIPRHLSQVHSLYGYGCKFNKA